MTSDNQAQRRPRTQSLALILLIIICVAVAGWALVTVSTTFQWKSSDFVALPTTPLSKSGTSVMFVNVSPIANGGAAVGVQGYLQTGSGAPIANAPVYITYYFEGAYRTQMATTDQNGYFQASFPMNWTGGLRVTVTYFGDDQHKGLTRVFSVSGESLVMGVGVPELLGWGKWLITFGERF